jgi:hypothetical protein
MRRPFRDDHFQRRPRMGYVELPGHGAAVASAVVPAHERSMSLEECFIVRDAPTGRRKKGAKEPFVGVGIL